MLRPEGNEAGREGGSGGGKGAEGRKGLSSGPLEELGLLPPAQPRVATDQKPSWSAPWRAVAVNTHFLKTQYEKEEFRVSHSLFRSIVQ